MKAEEMLNQLQKGHQELEKSIPETMERFWNFAEKAKEEGLLSKREKALAALAAVMAKSCERCIVRNLQDAISAGISREELAELCGLMMVLDGGPGFANSAFLLEKYDELIEQ